MSEADDDPVCRAAGCTNPPRWRRTGLCRRCANLIAQYRRQPELRESALHQSIRKLWLISYANQNPPTKRGQWSADELREFARREVEDLAK